MTSPPSRASAARSGRTIPVRLFAVVGVAAALVTAHVLGAGDVLTDRGRVERFFTESGVLGPLVFVGAFATSHPIGLPSVALTLVAGAVWPAPLAVALAWVGGMLGTAVGFSFARWVGRGWVEARLPPRWRRLDDRLARRALSTVVAVRLLTYLPPPADWLFGVSRMRWRDFVAGTAVGILPPTIVVAVLGDRLVDGLGDVDVWVWVAAGVLVAGAVTVRIVLRRRRRPGLAAPDVAAEVA